MAKKYKNIIIISAIILIAIIAIWISVTNKRSTVSNHFVVSDTTLVNKIFLADKNNNTVTLSRTNNSGWRLNDSLLPIQDNVELILKTLINTQIKYPVSINANNTAIKRLATNHVKVEVYGTTPLFELFGMPFFKKERKMAVFFVGGSTTDNLGTIMKAEDEDQIYVTYIPGFNGYLTERFSPKVADWKSHQIYAYMIGDLKKIRVDFPEKPIESYEITNNENRTFTLTRLFDDQIIAQFDTLKVLESLSAFSNVNFEALLDDMSSHKIDSLKKQLPIRVLTVQTISGEKHSLIMYQKPNIDHLLDFNGLPFPFDMDRLYGFIDDYPIPVSLQYFVIDNITRPLSYFINQTPENQLKIEKIKE